MPIYIQKLKLGIRNNSPFFVAVCMICCIYSLGSLMFYIFWSHIYKNKPRLIVGDLVSSGILALLLFIASCTWASSIGYVKRHSSTHFVIDRINMCRDAFAVCEENSDGKWGLYML